MRQSEGSRSPFGRCTAEYASSQYHTLVSWFLLRVRGSGRSYRRGKIPAIKDVKRQERELQIELAFSI